VLAEKRSRHQDFRGGGTNPAGSFEPGPKK
jgi:hypothetical protein